MTYRIIGFNDEVRKFHGQAQRFREEHRFNAPSLPSESALREYATERGYLPRKGRGVHPTKCQPVYFYAQDVPSHE
jgi:hypothetical protein